MFIKLINHSLISVQFSCSVTSDSETPMDYSTPGLPVHQQLPRAYSNSCPLSQWCHPTISSSVIPFSSHLQSFPAWGFFPMSQFFASGGQSIGVSSSASVLPMNIQDWFPVGWTGWISLQSKGLAVQGTLKSLLQHHTSKASILQRSVKFRLKLKKARKTTRSFRYDLNQIPYDYTVEVTNRFKGLDLIECLKNYGWRFVTFYKRQWSDQNHPQEKEMQKKQNGCQRRPYK